MVKCLNKLFKVVVIEILQVLSILGEYGTEVSYFIPKPKKCAEVTRLSEDMKKTWLK